MVQTPEPNSSAEAPQAAADIKPTNSLDDLKSMAFACIAGAGSDPGQSSIRRLWARRRDPQSGGWENLELELSEDTNPEQPLARLTSFLGERLVLVPHREAFCTWLGTDDAYPERHPLDLADLAALLCPGRLAGLGARLPGHLLGSSPDEWTPESLQSALGILIGRILGKDVTQVALLAHCLIDVRSALDPSAEASLRQLNFALGLLEHPSLWRGANPDLRPEFGALTDGQLSDALRVFASLEDALEASSPPWADVARENRRAKASLPPYSENPEPLDASDQKLVAKIFDEGLPQHFHPAHATPPKRHGQNDLAGRIASDFGKRELLLLQAPTGTGKTLAYLIPAMLWAYRHGVRVGVATYTRALQEQAMERDVPIALEMLAGAGVRDLAVSVLKGRQNYLCWRALCNQLPPASASAEELLLWLHLTLFGLNDAEGDLDRLSPRRPLPDFEEQRWRQEFGNLLKLVRAQTGCCSLSSDRVTCAAEAARARAERSHIVITNHAFAMARREFFRYLVFDECEHLHDVAHNAFSHSVGLRTLHGMLLRLHHPDRKQRPLNRVLQLAFPGSAPYNAARKAVDAQQAAQWAVADLGDALVSFKDWRDRKSSGREHSDTHSLFREFAESEASEAMLDAHDKLRKSLNHLSSELQLLAEHLDSLPTRDQRRIRRSFEILRGELDEHLSAVEAWIPRRDDLTPAFFTQTFHDLETSIQGEDVLAARVLLPHEYLGRHYYPDLMGVVLISATTWLKGGFDTSATFLGLTRAANPGEEEEREPSHLECYRAPEAFDYGRVLLAIPRDAPAPSGNKQAHLSYTARFVAYLAERTRGRMLVLFTNAADLLVVGEELSDFFAERQIPLWYQRMQGSSKEELAERFRNCTNSVLMGLDTFWYGTDFPGMTLEYVVIVRLPFGVPDRYHKAQCASLGQREQRDQIYMPRALAKFRQGFGRLMRRESDRGCVFVLDKRVNDPRHRVFLKELPLKNAFACDQEGLASLVTGDTEACVAAALDHMQLTEELRQRGLEQRFSGWSHLSSKAGGQVPAAKDVAAEHAFGDWGAAKTPASAPTPTPVPTPAPTPRTEPERLEIDEDSLPF